MKMPRTGMRRGRWRKKKNPMVRPRETEKPRSGAAWRLRCAIVLARDDRRCRYCGHKADLTYQVDHLVPRRLCPSPEVADLLENLAALCPEHHALKTHVVEPFLYRGNIQAFEEFMKVMASTGPVPPREMVGAAYDFISESLKEDRP